jgi:hypothetical protein
MIQSEIRKEMLAQERAFSQARQDVPRMLHQLVQVRIAPSPLTLLLEEGL